MCIAAAGLAMAVLAFLPWSVFPWDGPGPGGFSRSGLELPGLDGEVFLVFSLAISATGFIAVSRPGPMPLLVTLYAGIVASAISAQQVLTHWQAGSCFARDIFDRPTDFFGAAHDNFVCTIDYSRIGGDSFVVGAVEGSPAWGLWVATGLSAFVSLLAAWRLFARPPQSEPGPAEMTEAWA